MLFKITDKSFFEDNPEAKAIPSFVKVGEQAMKYICLTYGYNSPLRKMNLDEKKKKALSLSKFKKTPKGRPSKLETDLVEIRTDEVKNAISDYKEIQFDDDRDTMDAYDEQIVEFKSLMRNKDKSDKQLDQALKISEKMPKLLEIRKELREILDARDQEEFSMENESQSNIDNQSRVESFLSSL